jgi:transcriptional regulator with XRE-family HTH domain
MITNERQYKITKAELGRLQAALGELDQVISKSPDVDPVDQVHRASLASQVEEFSQLVTEYEQLISKKENQIEVRQFGELPTALIKARITMGMNQKDLAERLGVKEQQVQRWEADGYANISFANLKKVVSALGILVREEVFVPSSSVNAKSLMDKVKAMGIPTGLFLDRLVPAEFVDAFKNPGPSGAEGIVFKVAASISRVFKIPFSSLMSDDVVALHYGPVAAARFKAPAKANEAALNVYALYANYLALLTSQATEHLPKKNIPHDWETARGKILSYGPKVDFKTALQFVWDCGVPVMPLDDSGAFHGAIWRFDSRNVIVLKQRKHYASYWLHDLLHEFAHAGEHPDKREFTLIETGPISQERRESPSEEHANDFAEDVVFGNRSDLIEDTCVNESRGSVLKLKTAIPRVAERFNVDQGYLANYMAFILERENNLSFWGGATKLQEQDYSPFDYAREIFFERVKLNKLNDEDREMLIRGLRGGLENHA